MPKTTARGSADEGELPGTLQRSSAKAQRTFAKAHDSALEEYGDEERAHRVAYAALKHSYERVGDRWERKPGGKRGTSERPGQRRGGPTHEGVDVNATKEHLLDVARRLDIHGRSTMRKAELIDAIENANERARSND
ncbi:ChaB family protein [Tsukamurella tyrosinosolvens]|uniref:ChaB family protein n=1 Tax=Tsukamurella tyrosinosolvens TaxID=57704 RepID=UPI00079BEC33|nr:ChaB family protein [Tsukamurella tyrosinosolvens]AUN41468.1 cation transport regulator ChaB [Tsukamurella tyrosinosolvens]KXP04803.1 cation transport regulator ChaB [Tsukamurella tyrosinosolvens]KZL98057.1 cation transport regulator ChaB [Tsukamurella tyrosinosolvens]MCA4995289.1 ChaB family protein [Tsukamurella tyrosinosolvens]